MGKQPLFIHDDPHPPLSFPVCCALEGHQEGITMLDIQRGAVSLTPFSPGSSLAYPFSRGQLCMPAGGWGGAGFERPALVWTKHEDILFNPDPTL